jgi:hypothetical protein
MPAGVVLYGAPPFYPPNPVIPEETQPPFAPPFVPPPLLNPFETLAVCTKCSRHHRSNEPCIFCMRDELDALKTALGDKAKAAHEIERQRAFLRKVLGTLRELHQVTGSQRLADLITEGDVLLGHEPTAKTL